MSSLLGFDDMLLDLLATRHAMLTVMRDCGLADDEEITRLKLRWQQDFEQRGAAAEEAVDAVHGDDPSQGERSRTILRTLHGMGRTEAEAMLETILARLFDE